MSEKVVFWKDKSTGKSGHTEPMKGELASEWVKYGNKDFPNIYHWAKEVQYGIGRNSGGGE